MRGIAGTTIAHALSPRLFALYSAGKQTPPATVTKTGRLDILLRSRTDAPNPEAYEGNLPRTHATAWGWLSQVNSPVRKMLQLREIDETGVFGALGGRVHGVQGAIKEVGFKCGIEI